MVGLAVVVLTVVVVAVVVITVVAAEQLNQVAVAHLLLMQLLYLRLSTHKELKMVMVK